MTWSANNLAHQVLNSKAMPRKGAPLAHFSSFVEASFSHPSQLDSSLNLGISPSVSQEKENPAFRSTCQERSVDQMPGSRAREREATCMVDNRSTTGSKKRQESVQTRAARSAAFLGKSGSRRAGGWQVTGAGTTKRGRP